MASAEEVIRELSPLMFGNRVERMEAAAASRSFHILPIVEGLYDMGNLAAVCRTSDGTCQVRDDVRIHNLAGALQVVLYQPCNYN